MSGAKDAANHLYNTHATSLAMVVDPSQRLEYYTGNTVLETVSRELAEGSYRHGFNNSSQSSSNGAGA